MKDILTSSGNEITKKCSNKLQRIIKTLQWRQSFQSTTSFIHHFDDNDTVINVKQILNGEMNGLGTGTMVWPAAQCLCKYLELNKDRIKDKRICDIGTGTGITGLVCASLHAKEVVLTDQSQIIPLLQENVLNYNNISKCSITIHEYEWGCNIDHLHAPFDIILVSDCILPKLYPIEPLISAVKNVMNNHSIALFSYEHRTYPFFDPRNEFKRICKLYGLIVKVIPLSKHHKDYNCDEIELWEVTMMDDTGNNISYDDPFLHIIERNDTEYKVSIMNQLVHIKQGYNDNWMSSLWASSIILSRFIIKNDITIYHRNNHDDDDKRDKPLCLELGSGLGLVSISVLSKNMDIIATEKEGAIPMLHSNLQQFMETNQFNITSSYKVEVLDWSSFDKENKTTNEYKQELKQKILGNRVPDYILCSDCLYSTAAIKPLLETINYLSGEKTVLIMVNELRTALDEFILLARHDEKNPKTFRDIELSQDDSVIYNSDDSGLERYANRPVRFLITT